MKEVLFDIPAGTAASTCRGCGADVDWIIDGDGTSHFATCPMSGEFRRKREPQP
jgi:hypothetical protein